MSTVLDRRRPDHAFALAGIGLLWLLSLVALDAFGPRQAGLVLTGALLGVSLSHAAFGFAGSWRALIRHGRSVGPRAQVLMFALCALVFFPLIGGALPGIQAHAALAPVGVSVAVGAFLFGVGMQLGGACASGTLFTVGGGHVGMLLTFVFFIVGSFIGTIHLPWWTSLPHLDPVHTIASLGWPPALALQLGLLAALYLLLRRHERRRRGDLEPLLPARSGNGPEDRLLERLVRGPWPLLWGALGLALGNLLTLLLAGHPWSITFAFGLWGAKIFAALGGDPTVYGYWSGGYPRLALERSVLADVTSVMDMAIILGALAAAAIGGRFAPPERIGAGRVAAAVLGGLLLGYGARLAFGCNIGALFAGIASGSAHGWLWLVTGFLGNWAGTRLRPWFGLDRGGAGHG